MLQKAAKVQSKRYINTTDINQLQHTIMLFVDVWVHTQKTPIPHRQIIVHMKSLSAKEPAVIKAIAALLRKHYLRKAVTMSNRDRSYVQLRRV